mgnify:CR=1 FL=1
MRAFWIAAVFVLALVPLSAQAQEYYSWNGQSYPTLAKAAAAMRAHPSNANFGGDLVLCSSPLVISGNGVVQYKYCLEPKAIEPTGAGGYWVGQNGFRCAPGTQLTPGFEIFDPSNNGWKCIGNSESYVVGQFESWYRSESQWKNQCNLEVSTEGSHVDPLRYWGSPTNYADGGVTYNYVIAHSDNVSASSMRKIVYSWKVRNSDGTCSSQSAQNTTTIFKQLSYRCPVGYRVGNNFTVSNWPKICTATPYDPNIYRYNGYPADTNDNKCTGHPCVPATGEKLLFEADFDWAGHAFKRTYRSAAARPATFGFGENWTHSWSGLIMPPASVSTSVPAYRVDSGNNVEEFRLISGSTTQYRSINNRSRILEKQTDGSWLLADDGGVDYLYSAAGLLLSIRDDANPQRNLSFAYASNGLLETILDARGRALAFQHQQIGVLDPSSGASRNETRLTAIVDESGLPWASYAYDAAGRLSQVQYRDGESRLYHYGEADHLCVGAVSGCAPSDFWKWLTGVTDESGTRLSDYYFDASGRAVRSVHANGAYDTHLTYLSTTSTRVERIDGDTVTYTFENPASTAYRRRPLSETRSDGVQSWQYDTAHTWRRHTDRRGVKTKTEYNAAGLVAKVIEAETDPKTRSIVNTWSADNKLKTAVEIRDSAGAAMQRTNFQHNARAQVVSITVTDPATSVARTATTTYCEASDVTAGTCPLVGLVKSTDGARTDVADSTVFTYRQTDDPACATAPTTCAYRKGDLWKVANALSQTVEIPAYDGAGRPLATIDANGVRTDYEYHPRGWVTARKVRGTNDTSEADDQITQIEYWPTGLVKKVTQTDGAFTSYTYDAAHRLTGIADNAGNSISYTLNVVGDRIKEDTKDPSGTLTATLSRAYNTLGQLQTVTDAYNRNTGFTYDANGNLDLANDALSRRTDNDYDPLNRLSRTLQDSLGINAQTTFAYDALDNLVQVNDPKGLNTTYTYNGFSDLTQLSSPDTGATTYTYDSAGNRASQTDARGVTTTYAYDALNRLVSVGYPTSSLNASYVYDTAQTECAAGETFGVGRLTRMTDGSGNTAYCYDRFGQLVRRVQAVDGRVLTLRWAYLANGRLQKMTYPDNAEVDYLYDAQGRVTEIGYTPSGGARQVVLTGATYYAFGPVNRWTYGNGRIMERGRNLNYQPGFVEVQAPGGIDLGYEFDQVGNLKRLRTADQAEPPLRVYGYDGLNRLTQSQNGSTSAVLESYSYDKTGNRTAKTVGGSSTAYTYPGASHRLTDVGGVARGFDANGNTTAIGGTAKEFVYGDHNRMTQVKAGGVTTMNYVYNGRGERVHKWIGGNVFYSLYDEAGRWVGDYQKLTAGVTIPLQQVIWLGDLPVGLIVGDGTSQVLHYIEPDALGTPRVVVDPARGAQGTAVWAWPLTGEAFGDTAPNQDPDGDSTAFVFDMRFPGQRYDVATGLNYNYFRDYEAGAGRYSQSDPIGLIGGLSTYSYVGGSPLNSSDSLGLIVDSVRWTCIRDPAFCAELLGDLSQGQADLQRRLGNDCLADHYDAGADLADSFSPFLDNLGLARDLGRDIAGTINSPGRSPVLRAVDDSAGVTFGNNPNQTYHAFRHTDELGLDRDLVQSRIREHLATVSGQISAGKPSNFVVDVAGRNIQYTAFRLPNGSINIGRIHGYP